MTTWKPGDVAHIEGLGMAMHRGNDEWTRLGSIVRNPTKIRPLVVIDPESAEDRERLLTSIRAADHSLDCEGRFCAHGTLAAALREFAAPTPPKPAEPQGLGAVVETESGRRYVRTYGEADQSDYECWKADILTSRCRWSEIPQPVRVLSEGVTP